MKKKVIPVRKAIVIHQMALAPTQNAMVNAPTPAIFIKEKPGRGGKKVKYVAGGYVVNRLNEAFSPIGWEFDVVERGETARKNEKNSEGEVWVKGKLTIVDHKNGYRVSKTQFGQHPIHTNVPIGDAYKAASTDALKKCASMLGIALDVYWNDLESNGNEKQESKKEVNGNEVFEMAKNMIRQAKTSAPLYGILEQMKESKKLSAQQKKELEILIGGMIDKLDA